MNWHRFWFGQLDASFLPELALRMLVLFVAVALALRTLGPRTPSSPSRGEWLALVVLAAAVGPALQAPDRGLLPALMMSAGVVVWQRAVAALKSRQRRFHGGGATLVSDGVVDLAALSRCELSRERLFGELRSRGLRQLGQVRRAYFEDGSLSVVEQAEPRPGLSLVPSWDAELRREQPDDGEHVACADCGHLRARHAVEARCARCESEAWVPPVAVPNEAPEKRL